MQTPCKPPIPIYECMYVREYTSAFFPDSQSKNKADYGGDEHEDLIEHGWLCPVNSSMKIILKAKEKKMMSLYGVNVNK